MHSGILQEVRLWLDSNNFGLKQLCTTVKKVSLLIKALEYKDSKLKFACIAMHLLMMSFCPHDLNLYIKQ